MSASGPLDRGRFEELRDAYVLGALTQEERLELERDLAAHPERQAEVDELGAVAGLLALYPQEHDPPPDLRERIISTVEAEATVSSGRPPLSRRLGELPGARWLALGAAALLVVGLLSWNLALREDLQETRSQVQEMRASQNVRMITLEGPMQREGARVELIVAEGARAVLMVEEMPPVPEEKMCAIWVIDDGVHRPGGLFEPEWDAVATVVEAPLEGADAVAITIEPEGGSPQPTSDPMLTAEL